MSLETTISKIPNNENAEYVSSSRRTVRTEYNKRNVRITKIPHVTGLTQPEISIITLRPCVCCVRDVCNRFDRYARFRHPKPAAPAHMTFVLHDTFIRLRSTRARYVYVERPYAAGPKI